MGEVLFEVVCTTNIGDILSCANLVRDLGGYLYDGSHKTIKADKARGVATVLRGRIGDSESYDRLVKESNLLIFRIFNED